MSKYLLPYWDTSRYDDSQPPCMTGVKRRITLPWGEVALDMSMFQAAVSGLSTLGVNVDCYVDCCQVRPEFVLLDWFHDADNLELMEFTYKTLPPDEAVQHDAFYWMTKAVRDVFNVNTEMVWDLSTEVMIKHIKANHALQIEATKDPLYLALIGYMGKDDEFVTKEGWEHCCQFGDWCPNKLTPRAIAYWQ